MTSRNATAAIVGAGDYIGSAIARKFAAEGYQEIQSQGQTFGILSLAVVPIGITQLRDRLAPVTVVSRPYAAELLEWADAVGSVSIALTILGLVGVLIGYVLKVVERMI